MMSKPSEGSEFISCVNNTGTPDCVLEEVDDTIIRWYPLRIRFGNPHRAITIRDELRRQSVTTYLHMLHHEVIENNEIQYQMTPAVSNLIFVQTMKGRIKKLKRENKICKALQFIVKPSPSTNQREVLFVPDKQMENFIKAETLPDPYQQRVSLTYTDFIHKEHRKVRIIRGSFLGIEGEIKRIGRHKIVVILIRETHMAIGITHIAPNDLEFID